jgi:hypothetical protein
VAGQLGVEHGLEEGPQQQAVVGGDQVDRPPHDDDADDLSVEEQLAELVGSEAVEARPQSQVGVERHLGLHPDEVPDRLQRGQRRSPQQELPRQRGPAEGASVQDLAIQGYSPTKPRARSRDSFDLSSRRSGPDGASRSLA